MGQKKKERSIEFLHHQVDEEMVKCLADQVKKIREDLMQDYLDRKKKREENGY